MATWLTDLSGLFRGIFKGKRKFRSITHDEIRKERLRLEQTEIKLVEEIEAIETEKRQRFARGAAESSQRMQLIEARKFKELDAQAKQKDTQLALISKQIRVVSGLGVLKEKETILSDMGVSSVVGDMDLESLAKYVDSATVNGELQITRLGEILNVLESPDGSTSLGEDDEEVLSVLAAMQETQTEEQAGDTEAPERGLEKAQKALDKNNEDDPI